jgi:hypothetical protein
MVAVAYTVHRLVASATNAYHFTSQGGTKVGTLSALVSLPISETFQLLKACAEVGALLSIILLPIILIGYERWKERVR